MITALVITSYKGSERATQTHTLVHPTYTHSGSELRMFRVRRRHHRRHRFRCRHLHSTVAGHRNTGTRERGKCASQMALDDRSSDGDRNRVRGRAGSPLPPQPYTDDRTFARDGVLVRAYPW